MDRITRKGVEEKAKRVLQGKGLVYGNEKGNFRIDYTDSRCAPYLYRLVKISNEFGGTSTMGLPAMTAKKMVAFLEGMDADLN